MKFRNPGGVSFAILAAMMLVSAGSWGLAARGRSGVDGPVHAAAA